MSEILDPQVAKDSEDLVQASNAQRFANYIVDVIVLVLALVVVSTLFPSVLPLDDPKQELLLNLVFTFAYIIYGTLMEFWLGKTVGKFITRTHVVNANGYRPTFLNVLGRNFCRLIPFDNISFLLKRGWHDSISDTYVVKD